jgi:hypothetical protein
VNCCPYTFSAWAGYDATTGLGSPNFQVLAQLVLDSAAPFPASVIPAVPVISKKDSHRTKIGNTALAAIAITALVLAIFSGAGLLLIARLNLGLFRRGNADAITSPLIDERFVGAHVSSGETPYVVVLENSASGSGQD